MTFVIRTKQSNVFNRYVPKNKKHDKKWIRMILGHVSNLRLCAYIANIIFGRWVMGLFWSEPAWSSCSSLAFFASGALIFFSFWVFFKSEFSSVDWPKINLVATFSTYRLRWVMHSMNHSMSHLLKRIGLILKYSI